MSQQRTSAFSTLRATYEFLKKLETAGSLPDSEDAVIQAARPYRAMVLAERSRRETPRESPLDNQSITRMYSLLKRVSALFDVRVNLALRAMRSSRAG